MIESRAELYEHALLLVSWLASDAASGVVSAERADMLAVCLREAVTELRDDEAATVERITEDLPALARWTRLATTNTKRRAPLDIAAGWEVRALLHQLAGDPERAASDIERAHAVAA